METKTGANMVKLENKPKYKQYIIQQQRKGVVMSERMKKTLKI